MIRSFLFSLIGLFFSVHVYSQTCSNTYPGGAVNWSALSWSCAGGGSAPSSAGTYTENLSIATIGNGDNLTFNINITLNGNLTVSSSGSNPTITVPAGVTFVIKGNFTDNDNNVNFIVNGTLIITGTFKGKNNAVLGGTGSISGGTLDLGSGASCQSGQCPSLSFKTCNVDAAFCSANVGSSTTYLWNGSVDSSWGSSGNWTPVRTSPASTDILVFDASGANKNINNVPNETLGEIFVTGNATYTFTPTATNTILSLTRTSGNALQIDNGSSLSIGVSAGNSLGMNLAASSEASIGGQLNLTNGNFDISNATLILHTNPAPLARTSGQVSANSSSTIKFGDTGLTGGSTITLPNTIFVASPIIGSLVMNRTNGAALGDQSITVTSSTTFTLGDLTTNAAGKIIFDTSVPSPTESSNSKIIGYADMAFRTIGTGALDFLGLNMLSGANDLGSLAITRKTGSAGINTFNSSQSIASTWIISRVGGGEPTSGRTISFSWQSAFDNVTTASKKFQIYRFNSGPGWTNVGSLQLLSAQGPPRVTGTATTTQITDTFTVTDETQTLPIELISFYARTTTTSIHLFWKTATETNNDYFLVERMNTDHTFSAIAKIAGAGTTLQEMSYSVIDEKPKQGANYYRLTQVDFDHQRSYSDVIRQDFYGAENTAITIYPNPSEGILNFDNLEEEAAVSFGDASGRVLFTAQVKPEYPSLSITDYHLSPGLYFVRIQNSKDNQVKKLVIK